MLINFFLSKACIKSLIAWFIFFLGVNPNTLNIFFDDMWYDLLSSVFLYNNFTSPLIFFLTFNAKVSTD